VPHDDGVARDGPYMRTVRLALRHPGMTLALAAFLLIAVQTAYGRFGRGVEFFPSVEPDYGQVLVHARGNISLDEKNRLMAEVEKRVLGFDSLKTVYARIGEQPRGMGEMTEDTIGVIQFEFVDWRQRPSAHDIMDAIREKTADIPGILVEVTAPRAGPPTGKPIQVQLSAIDPTVLPNVAKKVAGILSARSELLDLDDGQPLPGIDWKIVVDKAEAAKYGAGVGPVGSAVQLVTNGLKASEYRPVDSDKAVDILVRFPPDRRNLDQIDDLRIQTPLGHVPIGNFVERVPAQRVGYINRVNANRVVTVSANIAEGVQTANVQQAIAQELSKADLGPGVSFKMKGEDEEREKAGAFLMKAFGTAIFLIFAILLAQFNRLTSVGLVLTAVVLSTFGVLLGLMVMGQPFGVVMTGIGVIANAGVIVNNNIVLIDTYDRLKREGMAAYDAIIETCRERARPVVLTAVTAILGVLPIAFGMNVEFLSREITVGAPATQWWIGLSTAIVFGLGFATVLTLVVTPAALMTIENMREKRLRWGAALRARFGRRRQAAA
jgi:multidrug efflux pump